MWAALRLFTGISSIPGDPVGPAQPCQPPSPPLPTPKGCEGLAGSGESALPNMTRRPSPARGLTPGVTAPPGAWLQGRLTAQGPPRQTPTCSTLPPAQWLPRSEEAQNTEWGQPGHYWGRPSALRGGSGPRLRACPAGQP